MHFDPDGKTSRRPLLWGGVFSILGSVSVVLISSRLFSVFTPQSILHSPFDSSFVVAVLVAATLWVLAAALVRLAVSTTHAILGAIMLQGIFLFGLSSLAWDFLVIRILLPLAGGPLAALIGIYLFERLTKRPQVPGKEKPKWVELAHWGSAAATAYARGANDAPKMAVLGGFFLVANSVESVWVPYSIVAGAGFVWLAVLGGRGCPTSLSPAVSPRPSSQAMRGVC